MKFSAAASLSLRCTEDDKICRDQERASKTCTINNSCIRTVCLGVCFTNQIVFPVVYTQTKFMPGPSQV